MEEKEVEMHTQNIKDKDKFIKAKEEKMQMECSSVRREMACCAALRLLGTEVPAADILDRYLHKI